MRMLARFLTLLLFLTSLSASASLLSQQGKAVRYMQTTEDAVIWAQVGNHVVSVGNVLCKKVHAFWKSHKAGKEFYWVECRG